MTSEFRRKQELLREAFHKVPGVKVNSTDIRISAMEDLVGRNNRRLSSVIRHAWEFGVKMNFWWENLDKAHSTEQAIDYFPFLT